MFRALLTVFLVLVLLTSVVVIVLYSGYRLLNSLHATSVIKDGDCQDIMVTPLQNAM